MSFSPFGLVFELDLITHVDQELVRREDDFVSPKGQPAKLRDSCLFCFAFVLKRNLSEHYNSSIPSTEFKHVSSPGV